MKKFAFAFLATVFLAAPALVASPSYYLQGKGETTFDATELATAASARGVQVSVLSGTVSDGADVFTFPIVGGGIDAGTFVYEAVHTGGLTLSDGTSTVTLNAPVINTIAAKPILTMLVTVNGNLLGRYTVGDVRAPALNKTVTSGSKVKIKHLQITLSAIAADLLNEAYPTGGFSTGQPVATVTMKMFVGNQLP